MHERVLSINERPDPHCEESGLSNLVKLLRAPDVDESYHVSTTSSSPLKPQPAVFPSVRPKLSTRHGVSVNKNQADSQGNLAENWNRHGCCKSSPYRGTDKEKETSTRLDTDKGKATIMPILERLMTEIREQIERLHQCKRGLNTARPADYNEWWRTMEKLLATLEAIYKDGVWNECEYCARKVLMADEAIHPVRTGQSK